MVILKAFENINQITNKLMQIIIIFVVFLAGVLVWGFGVLRPKGSLSLSNEQILCLFIVQNYSKAEMKQSIKLTLLLKRQLIQILSSQMTVSKKEMLALKKFFDD